MDRAKVLEANVARAKAFAEEFPNLKVGHVGTMKDASGMAAYHDAATGLGFTAQFLTTADGKNHIHAWLEYVGDADRAGEIAAQFKKIVGA